MARHLLGAPAVDGPDGTASGADDPPAGGQARLSGPVGGAKLVPGGFDQAGQLRPTSRLPGERSGGQLGG